MLLFRNTVSRFVQYSVIAETFEMMEKTTKRLELTDYLVKLLKSIPSELIDKVVYLIQGKLYPDYQGVELGIADKLALLAVSISSGLNMGKIEHLYIENGDIGAAGELALQTKMQTTLFSEDITVERVYSTLAKMQISITIIKILYRGFKLYIIELLHLFPEPFNSFHFNHVL